MLRAKGAAIYYSVSGRKTCSTSADPVVSLVHYCRFIIKGPKERHAFKVQRGQQTQSGGEADGHRCFRGGTQTDTVQPGTREQIPHTFLVFADQMENSSFRTQSLCLFEASLLCGRMTIVFKNAQNSPLTSVTATGQSVWNTATLGLGHGEGVLLRRLEEGDSNRRVDELVGNGWRISQCTCNRCWSDVHTNRGNKVLLIKTPGIKMVGSFARRVVWQLEMGHI